MDDSKDILIRQARAEEMIRRRIAMHFMAELKTQPIKAHVAELMASVRISR